jgi:hypothetical protein
MSPVAHAQWLDAWTRSVIVPASRRAAAVWVGCAILAAVTFGGNGLSPEDLTGLASRHVGVATVLGATWLLVFAPTARLLVRAEAAAYLRSLPHPTLAPRLLKGGALVALQGPWVALWIAGEGLGGLVVVAATTVVLVALAAWRPPTMRARWPAWRRDTVALRAIHLRALRRRAGDALIRGVGLALLAGTAAGLFIRNNHLGGSEAATMGTSVIVVVLVPAVVGVHLVILATHRQTAWLAASLGATRGARVGAVVYALGVVHLCAMAIAAAAAALIADADARTIAWLGKLGLVTAIASAMAATSVLLSAEDSPTAATRAVVGGVAIAAIVVLCLGLFGELGGPAVLACAALALSRVVRG